MVTKAELGIDQDSKVLDYLRRINVLAVKAERVVVHLGVAVAGKEDE